MKKRTMKRSIAMGLAVITAAGCLTGCGGSENQASTDANGRYNLKVMTYDYSGYPMKGETGAEIIEKVEDYTGVNLDVMWTPKDNYNDKLNLILAGGGEDMPQIIATETKSPAIINAAKAGALWDIEELLQEFPHLKNSKAVVNDNIRIDGKLYGIYRGRALGRYGMTYRKDWADKLG